MMSKHGGTCILLAYARTFTHKRALKQKVIPSLIPLTHAALTLTLSIFLFKAKTNTFAHGRFILQNISSSADFLNFHRE